jgi:hypothetical protein
MFPTVAKGCVCGEFDERLLGETKPAEGAATQ